MALSVIGAGFGRTGTESMKTALEILGFGPCHHMKVILSNPEMEAYWRGVLATGDNPDWDEAYEGFGSGVDWPTACYWQELADHWPEAKILLTVRDSDSWYESINKSILPVINKLTDPDSIGLKMLSKGVFDDRLGDRDYAIALYEKNIADVKAAFSPERLLVFSLGAGWDPLCNFLDVPVPDEPFPRSNSGEEFNEFFADRIGNLND